jgi:iron-sulfur cluster assembly protein
MQTSAESNLSERSSAAPPGATTAAPVAPVAQSQGGAQTGLRAGVNITEAAVKYAKRRLEQRGTPNAAVRLGIRGGGCSGFSYVIEFSDEAPRSRDTVSEFGGVKFYVDKKSLIYLGGSTLDYVNSLMFQGFKFLNPQEATKCGCGHSFTVK